MYQVLLMNMGRITLLFHRSQISCTKDNLIQRGIILSPPVWEFLAWLRNNCEISQVVDKWNGLSSENPKCETGSASLPEWSPRWCYLEDQKTWTVGRTPCVASEPRPLISQSSLSPSLPSQPPNRGHISNDPRSDLSRAQCTRACTPPSAHSSSTSPTTPSSQPPPPPPPPPTAISFLSKPSQPWSLL